MRFLTLAEQRFVRRNLSVVRHVTLDPDGPGVLRIHLLPCRTRWQATPLTAILNGQTVLPLDVSWAILLANLMTALEPYEGQELTPDQWGAIQQQAVQSTLTVYQGTPAEQIEGDLEVLLAALVAIARGQQPPVSVPAIDLGAYAPRMVAPHRIDLMISAMTKGGAWHCNQKCLHCYAAGQPLAETPELTTDQWLTILQKCRAAGIPQVTFTGGEPTLRADLVPLVEAAQWFVTRLNTNGRLLTPELCGKLRSASLDAVQITLYSADADTHNTLVGAQGFADTVAGLQNAVAAGLNVSINTPLCSVNENYLATVQFAQSLGVRYFSCSGLIPAGSATGTPSVATRLSPAALADVLRPAMDYAAQNGLEIQFTSPGWLPDEVLLDLGFTQLPSCGACLSNMAIAPDGTVLPCQSWLSGPGLGNILHTPWQQIWNGRDCRRIRGESAKMEHICQLGQTPMREGC